MVGHGCLLTLASCENCREQPLDFFMCLDLCSRSQIQASLTCPHMQAVEEGRRRKERDRDIKSWSGEWCGIEEGADG